MADQLVARWDKGMVTTKVVGMDELMVGKMDDQLVLMMAVWMVHQWVDWKVEMLET